MREVADKEHENINEGEVMAEVARDYLILKWSDRQVSVWQTFWLNYELLGTQVLKSGHQLYNLDSLCWLYSINYWSQG